MPGIQKASDPIFSLDGQSVGFYADGKLKRLGVYWLVARIGYLKNGKRKTEITGDKSCPYA